MPIDRTGDPWPETSDEGRPSRPVKPPGSPAAPLHRGRRRRTLLIGGVVTALMLGLGFGFWARPQLIGAEPVSGPAEAAAGLATPSAGQVPIAVSPPPAQETLPRAPGRLETLPPEMAAAARAQVQAGASSTPPVAVSALDAPAPATPDIAYAPPEASAPAPAPDIQASFDCATARPGAEQMVCSEPALAAADRQMARAYRRALRSGVAPGDLLQEQRDWMAIREDAARRSPVALAQAYDQRLRELQRIAEGAPGAQTEAQ